MGSDERAKMKTLLNYLAEHNQEHSREIREWANKASIMGEAGLADEMLQAARMMDQAGTLLYQSLKRLEEV